MLLLPIYIYIYPPPCLARCGVVLRWDCRDCRLKGAGREFFVGPGQVPCHKIHEHPHRFFKTLFSSCFKTFIFFDFGSALGVKIHPKSTQNLSKTKSRKLLQFLNKFFIVFGRILGADMMKNYSTRHCTTYTKESTKSSKNHQFFDGFAWCNNLDFAASASNICEKSVPIIPYPQNQPYHAFCYPKFAQNPPRTDKRVYEKSIKQSMNFSKRLLVHFWTILGEPRVSHELWFWSLWSLWKSIASRSPRGFTKTCTNGDKFERKCMYFKPFIRYINNTLIDCVSHFFFVLAWVFCWIPLLGPSSFLCWRVGLFAFRCCVRHFFFVVTCECCCVSALRQSLFVAAGLWVFWRAVVGSIAIILFCAGV